MPDAHDCRSVDARIAALEAALVDAVFQIAKVRVLAEQWKRQADFTVAEDADAPSVRAGELAQRFAGALLRITDAGKGVDDRG